MDASARSSRRYLDFVFLGQGAYGMVAAARAYFDRDVAELDLPQAALLAGLIQAPSRLDPYDAPGAGEGSPRRGPRAHVPREADRRRRRARRPIATPIALRRPRPSYGTRVPWYTEQVRALIASALPDELRAVAS